MTDLHPLAQKIASGLSAPIDEDQLLDVDTIVREHLAPPEFNVEIDSGPYFPDLAGVGMEVATTFMRSGSQMQMLLVGTEPVLVVQPEYSAENDKVTFVITAVDLNAEGMLPVLRALTEATEEMISQVEQMRADAADEA